MILPNLHIPSEEYKTSTTDGNTTIGGADTVAEPATDLVAELEGLRAELEHWQTEFNNLQQQK